MSRISDFFQKNIFESSTLYHIMPFAKMIGPVKKIGLKGNLSRFFLVLFFINARR